MRPNDEADAADLVNLIEWIPLVIRTGELGRHWRPSDSGIGAADLIIAATAELSGATLLTLNGRHFPMIAGLRRPY